VRVGIVCILMIGRESIASPAESDFDDDDEEPGNEGRNPKRKFDDSIIQQRMEEDRERVRVYH